MILASSGISLGSGDHPSPYDRLEPLACCTTWNELDALTLHVGGFELPVYWDKEETELTGITRLAKGIKRMRSRHARGGTCFSCSQDNDEQVCDVDAPWEILGPYDEPKQPSNWKPIVCCPHEHGRRVRHEACQEGYRQSCDHDENHDLHVHDVTRGPPKLNRAV